MKTPNLSVILAVLLSAVGSSGTAFGQKYSVTNLGVYGTLNTLLSSYSAPSLSDDGTVGFSGLNNQPELYSDGKTTAVAWLPNSQRITDISSGDIVVGGGYDPSIRFGLYEGLVEEYNQSVDISMPPLTYQGQGGGVNLTSISNSSLHIAGSSLLLAGSGAIEPHATLWTNGSPKLLPTPGIGVVSSDALAVNNKGTVVGDIQQNGTTTGVVWFAGTNKPTQLIPHLTGGLTALNDRNVIAGYTSSGGFLWDNGFVETIGAPPGTNNFVPMSLNDSDQVIGYSYNPTSAEYTAYLWQDGAFSSLNNVANDPGFQFEGGVINDAGQIAAVGYNQTAKNNDAVLLTPKNLFADTGTTVPEPSGLGLAFAGIVVLVWRKR